MSEDRPETIEEALETALEHAENEDAQYWIRVALQHHVVHSEHGT